MNDESAKSATIDTFLIQPHRTMSQPTRSLHTVRGFDVLRGFIRSTPRIPALAKGVWRLATAKAEKKESIGSIVAHWAATTPNQTAVIFGGQRWTYNEFNTTANRWAGVLRRVGIKKGDTVAVLLENRIELLAAVTAIVKLGGIVGMLNYNQRGSVLDHSVKLVKAKALIIGQECSEAYQSLAASLREELLPCSYWLPEAATDTLPDGLTDLIHAAEGELETNPPETANVQYSDACFYVFTSGTTGMPKAAVMSHGRWARALAGIGLASLGMRSDDVFYCALPFYHNNALTLSWGATLSAGATLAIARKFSASRFWDEVRAVNATAFCYIGEMCRYLLAQPPSPIDRMHRVRVCIGNGLRPELWAAFRTRYNIPHINEFYGASEGNLVFTNAFDVDSSCGFCPLPYAIVEFNTATEEPVRNGKGQMKKVARGEVGLLLGEVTDRTPFDGYTSKKDSEKKLFRHVFKPDDCYFNSGDLVRDLGYRHIQFIDRVGDTFRWKGENVATTEVESAFESFAAVAEAVVYGVLVPGADGRAGMAALTLTSALDGAALARHLKSALPAYAVPVFLRIREHHDTTGTFKARKTELKQEGFRGTPDPVLVLSAADDAYVPLTAPLLQQIELGEFRF